jgi:hypothetical protein
MGKDYISSLLRSNNTVFTFKDLSLIWGDTDRDYVTKRVYRYIKAGKLYAVRKGIYAKDKNYNRFELATKIYTPSYISLETVLAQAGIIFQYYGQIFVASYLTREITADDQKYTYKKIKDSILTNHTGLINKENYTVASPERAFLDVLYLNKDYYFDNPSKLDWEKVFEILKIYGGNKRMEKIVKKYKDAVNKEGK